MGWMTQPCTDQGDTQTRAGMRPDLAHKIRSACYANNGPYPQKNSMPLIQTARPSMLSTTVQTPAQEPRHLALGTPQRSRKLTAGKQQQLTLPLFPVTLLSPAWLDQDLPAPCSCIKAWLDQHQMLYQAHRLDLPCRPTWHCSSGLQSGKIEHHCFKSLVKLVMGRCVLFQ